MIQRIQTVYLILTTFIAVLFISGHIIAFDNGQSVNLFGLTVSSANHGIEDTGRNWHMAVLLLIVPVISFITIFLFKKRRLQKNFNLLLILFILVSVAAVGHYSYNYMNSSGAVIVFTYKLILPLLMLLFSILAYRSIRKDEDIVRSYDRLR